jgi:hypothetical protein
LASSEAAHASRDAVSLLNWPNTNFLASEAERLICCLCVLLPLLELDDESPMFELLFSAAVNPSTDLGDEAADEEPKRCKKDELRRASEGFATTVAEVTDMNADDEEDDDDVFEMT